MPSLSFRFGRVTGQNFIRDSCLAFDDFDLLLDRVHFAHRLRRLVEIANQTIDHKDNPGQTWNPGDPASPLNELKYPVWYIVGGGGGAPYYSKEATPWNSYWESLKREYPNHTSKRGCFYYSSQENVFIFKTKGPTLSLTVYNPYGEIIDAIDDLLKVKQNL